MIYGDFRRTEYQGVKVGSLLKTSLPFSPFDPLFICSILPHKCLSDIQAFFFSQSHEKAVVSCLNCEDGKSESGSGEMNPAAENESGSG